MSTIAIREKPIIIPQSRIPALLDGRMTQMRVPVKLKGLESTPHVEYADDGMPIWCQTKEAAIRLRAADPGYFSEGFPCPFGGPGDRLWLRETWSLGTGDGARMGINVQVKTEPWCVEVPLEHRKTALATAKKIGYGGKWRSPATMPRWASRITLELIGVRVEQLGEMQGADVVAEGFPFSSDLDQFKTLWKKLHGKWDPLCWVWVLEFRRIER